MGYLTISFMKDVPRPIFMTPDDSYQMVAYPRRKAKALLVCETFEDKNYGAVVAKGTF